MAKTSIEKTKLMVMFRVSAEERQLLKGAADLEYSTGFASWARSTLLKAAERINREAAALAPAPRRKAPQSARPSPRLSASPTKDQPATCVNDV